MRMIANMTYGQTVYRYRMARGIERDGGYVVAPEWVRTPRDERVWAAAHGVDAEAITWLAIRDGDTPVRRFEAFEQAYEGQWVHIAMRDLFRSVRWAGHNRERRVKAMTEWVAQYGYLSVSPMAAYETYEAYWREAEYLARLWDMLGAVRRRRMEVLEEYIRPYTPGPNVIVPTLAEWVHSRCDGPLYVPEPGRPIDALRYYQFAVLTSLAQALTMDLFGQDGPHRAYVMPVMAALEPRDHLGTSTDDVRVAYALTTGSMAGAIRLAMMAYLSDSTLRICAECGMVYSAATRRSDAEYCSATCGARARKRRERQRRQANQ